MFLNYIRWFFIPKSVVIRPYLGVFYYYFPKGD